MLERERRERGENRDDRMFKTFLVTILEENFADIGNGNSCLVFAKVLLSPG